MIDDLTIRKIKEASNIVDVLNDFYPEQLRKRGANYMMLCPFHPDRHIGSFVVNETRNFYKCFSCGASGGPIDFLMEHEGYTYPDALRWLGKKYLIEVEGAERFTPKPCKPHAPAPKLPMLVLPNWMVSKTMHTEEDTLCNWLRGLPWDAAQRARVEEVLLMYCVGHGKEGHTIFWQIDDKMRVRTGKTMLYKKDGHRDKETPHNFDYIHSMLEKAKMKKYYDVDKEYRELTYFGMHLLDIYPQATINVVESEKTALIMSIAYGDFKHRIWIATGGLENLNREKLAPVMERKRHMVLYPDHDAMANWEHYIDAIGYERLRINNDLMREFWKPSDGEKADIADVLIRLISDTVRIPKGERDEDTQKPLTLPTALDDFLLDYPALAKLVDNLDLELVDDATE